MKLEVGMYIRTKWGYICELININDFREPSMKYGVEATYLRDVMFIGDEDILKASNKIIDLIQEGDYVNGVEVLRIDKECDLYPKTLKCQYPNNVDYFDIFNEDIKSILTKEEYERMVYKVNEYKN